MLRQEQPIAAEAFDLLISSDVFAPSYARYYETYCSVARRQPAHGELTASSVTPPDAARQILRAMRAASE